MDMDMGGEQGSWRVDRFVKYLRSVGEKDWRAT